MKQIRLTRRRSVGAAPWSDPLGFDLDDDDVLPVKGLFDLAGVAGGRPSNALPRRPRRQSGKDRV
jgi:hypothetical protein